MTLLPIHAKNTGAAIRLLSLARAAHLQASYHPSGGMTSTKDRPVSHVVWVMGPARRVQKFCEASAQAGKESHS